MRENMTWKKWREDDAEEVERLTMYASPHDRIFLHRKRGRVKQEKEKKKEEKKERKEGKEEKAS